MKPHPTVNEDGGHIWTNNTRGISQTWSEYDPEQALRGGHTLSFCKLRWMRELWADGGTITRGRALRVRYLSHALDLLLPATSCHTGYCWRTLGGSSGRSSSLPNRRVCLCRDGSGWTFGPRSSSHWVQLSLWAPLRPPCVNNTNPHERNYHRACIYNLLDLFKFN